MAYLRLEKVSLVSREHNTRILIPDYVRKDLMDKNAYYFFNEKKEIIPKPLKTHRELEEELKQIYKESTGQKIQDKMNPLVEGLFLFSEKNTDEEILKSVQRFGEEFGVRIIELHLHRDEGYYNRDEEWIANLHGHFVFENIERNDVFVMQKKKKGADKGKEVMVNLKGRTHKFNKTQTSKMQDFFAEQLGLQRGKSNNREHLTHIEWKNKKIKEEYQEIKAEIKEKEGIRSQLEQDILEKKEILKADISLKDFKEEGFLGRRWNVDKLQKLVDSTKILQRENESLKSIINLDFPIEKEKLHQYYQGKLKDKDKVYENLRKDYLILQKDKENADKVSTNLVHFIFDEELRKEYLKEKKAEVDANIQLKLKNIAKEREISIPTDVDRIIKDEMYALAPKSNRWSLLVKLLGEDYESKLLDKAEQLNEERRAELKSQEIKKEENIKQQGFKRLRR